MKMDSILKRKNSVLLVFLIVVCTIPLFVKNTYALKVINNVMIYSIIALSINLIVGFSGQLDFGRSAFAGIGGYFSAIMMSRLGVPFIISFVGGGLFACLLGLLLGMLCRYSSFDYLTLITIGFSEIVRLILQNWIKVTGGAFGFVAERPKLFGYTFATHQSMFYFNFVLLILCYIVIRRITRSKMGRAFMALRDDPIAAAYAGIDVAKYKMINFAVASFFTGIAGAALVHYTMFASPTNYTIDESLIMLQMPILGGLGSLPGSIVGTVILTVLPEISRSFYNFRLLFMGALMVILMLFAPNGLFGVNGIRDQIMAYVKLRKGEKKE